MILEVDQSAGLELIVKSYHRLALKLHPDRNPRRDATEAFQKVCQTNACVNSSTSVLTRDSLDERTRP